MESMGIKSSKNLMIADISDYRMDYSDEKILAMLGLTHTIYL
jgi:hypothetical protein